MPLTILRVRHSQESRRLMAQILRAGLDRKAAMQELCESVGCKLVQIYISMTTGEGVNLIEGPPEEISVIHQVMWNTGAYDTMETEVCISVDEHFERRDRVADLTQKFTPPDRDEIDRMLLDE